MKCLFSCSKPTNGQQKEKYEREKTQTGQNEERSLNKLSLPSAHLFSRNLDPIQKIGCDEKNCTESYNLDEMRSCSLFENLSLHYQNPN